MCATSLRNLWLSCADLGSCTRLRCSSCRCRSSSLCTAATATKLKFIGVDLYSAGAFVGVEGSEDLILRDPRRGIYKRLILKHDQIVGAVLYGDFKDGPWYFELIQNKTDISTLRNQLLFGQVFCTQAA